MILKNKIILAQMPLGIAVIIVSFMFLFAVNSIGNETNDILLSNYKSLTALEEMRKIVDNIDDIAWQTTRNENKNLELLPKINHLVEDFKKNLIIQKNSINISVGQELTEELEKKWELVINELNNYTAHSPDFHKIYDSGLHKELLEVKAALSLLSDLNENDIFYRTENITLAISHMSKVVLFVTLLSFLIGLLLSAHRINQILTPLSQLTGLIKQASEGKLGGKLDIKSNDEVADLGREFNKLVASIEDYRNSTVGHVLQTRLFMQTAIDSYPDPILIMDKDFKTLNINHSAAEFFEFDQMKNYMEDFINIIPKEIKERIIELSKFLLNETPDSIPEALKQSIKIEYKNNKCEFLINARAVYETLKGVIGITVIMRNITNLNVKGYIKTDNVTQMMNALLLPLNSIHIAIHACLEQKIGPLNEKQTEVLAFARNDCFRLRRNMVNLEDLNYVENNQFSILHRLNLIEIIKDVIASFEVLASTQEVTIHTEFESLESYIYANDYQIKLVLENLIDNAVSHSEPGYTVTIKLYEREGMIKLLIHNGGTVIPNEFKKKIFDKFFQLPGDQSSKDGLGLYICKTVVENYGGKIGVKSSERLGTSFWLKLPKSE